MENITLQDLSLASNLIHENQVSDFFSSCKIESERISDPIGAKVETIKPPRVFPDPTTQFRYLPSNLYQYRLHLHSFSRFMADGGLSRKTRLAKLDYDLNKYLLNDQPCNRPERSLADNDPPRIPMMNTVAIALSNKNNARLLTSALASKFNIIDAEQITPSTPCRFDLCIVDECTVNQFAETLSALKHAESPAALPILLLTSRNHGKYTLKMMWAFVDDVIHTPIPPAELEARIQDFVQQRQSAKQLKSKKNELLTHSQNKLEMAVRAGNVGFFEWDLKTNSISLSPEFKQHIGFAALEFPDDLEAWKQRIHPDDREQRAALETDLMAGLLPAYSTQFRILHKDGQYRWIETNVTSYTNVDGSELPSRLIGVNREISAEKRNEENMRIAATVFESNDAIIITDQCLKIIRTNKAFSTITGFSQAEAIGKNPNILKSGMHGPEVYYLMRQQLETQHYWTGELWNKRKNGELYPTRLSITAVLNEDSNISHYVGTSIDITEEKKAEVKMRFLSLYDPLTELPNRRGFEEFCRDHIQQSNQTSQSYAVLLIDLDQFKLINDSRGHHFGDIILQEISKRLTGCIRRSDFLARLGADEFITVLQGLDTSPQVARKQVESIAKHICSSIKEPITKWGLEYFCSCSVGIYLTDCKKVTTEELLKRADTALHRAKMQGRNTICFFTSQMEASIEYRASLETDLHRALDQQEFQLHFQLQTNSKAHFVGAEVLLRWQHPIRGMVTPADFIPLAEECGLIIPIGFWVLESACQQLKNWETDTQFRDLILAVNVSARQFSVQDFVPRVINIIKASNINPKKLKLEITESLLISGLNVAIEKISELRAFGLCFSLDDFGTGYSALSYLKHLPLDQIKIDQSFVKDIVLNRRDAAIVKTIIGISQSLEFEVIAEGVETEEQKAFLMNHGCNNFQGYLFSKPLILEQFEYLIKPEEANPNLH